MAEFDPLRPGITGRQAYHLQVPGTASASGLSVVSFTATEAMGEPTEVIIEATHPEPLPREDYLNLDAVFTMTAEDGSVRKFSGYLERVSAIQKTHDLTKYQFALKSHFGRLAAVTTTQGLSASVSARHHPGGAAPARYSGSPDDGQS